MKESAEAAKTTWRQYHIFYRSVPRTHGPRIQRRNSIARLLADECAKQGWQVTWAPRIRMSGGIKKPDLIISNNYKIAIVDITVVWDSP